MGRAKKDYCLKKRGKVYYYRLKGQRNFKTTKETSKARAENFVNRLLQKQGFLSVSSLTFWKYSLPFFIRETCPHVRRLEGQGKTVTDRYLEINRLNLNTHVKDSILAQLEISEIRKAHLIDFRYALLKKGLKPATVNKIMSAVKIVFHEAAYREDIINNPAQDLGCVVEQPKTDSIFSSENLYRLFSSYDATIWRYPLTYYCFLLTALTGMRRGEVLALQWRQIDFENNVIFIDRAWKNEGNEIGLPKNGKTRYCGLAKPLKDALLEWKKDETKPEDLVFSNEKGLRLKATWWNKRFSFALNKAGIEDGSLVPHRLRHTINTVFIERGMSEQKIDFWVGWSRGNKIQDRYTHLRPEALAELTIEIEKWWTSIITQELLNKSA
jgi:integrase